MNRQEKLEMLANKNFNGMKVRDIIYWTRENVNGNVAIYDIRSRMYVDKWNNEVLNMVPKKVTFHRGYGFGQIDTVVRVFIPKNK